METTIVHAPVADRTRANTSAEVNERIDRQAQLQISQAAAAPGGRVLEDRLEQLNAEWNFDRVLETEASMMGLVGLALALGVDRRFLLLPGFVSTMVLVHAAKGWYPLLPVFRRIGIRTADEIDKERYALKALRGDFARLPASGAAAARAAAAWDAVCA